MDKQKKFIAKIPSYFVENLTLLLIAFKLAGIGEVASWSWWQVFLPIWAAIGFWLFFVLLYLICVIILKISKK